ncbi:RNA-guided endonuclease TnpB family protein [Anaerovoracaceae bacterium 42-11]
MSRKINRGIKYRIYPTTTQRELISRTFGCSRFVYNHMLGLSKEAYARGEKICSRNKFNYLLTNLKKEYPWLSEVDATALTAANDALASSFSNFFAKRSGFPKFHKKKNVASYTSKRIQGVKNIDLGASFVNLPKLGSVKAKIHRRPKDDWSIKSATVSQESDGKYYVSIRFEFFQPENSYVAGITNAIALDYASDGLFIDNNGKQGSNHKYYRESYARLARAQRKLSRKTGSGKGEPKSQNYIKQLRKVGKIHRHIANQRLDNLHKLSTEIANQYDVVCVEDINLRSMANKGFGNGKATLDNGYGMFLTMLEYKLSDRNKHFVKVDKWFPSSQICHCCGHKNPLLKDLKIRKWECPVCGAHHGRDINAAINILNEGLRILASS